MHYVDGMVTPVPKAKLAEYRRMSRALLDGIGDTPDVQRELAFRWVLATASPIKMAARYFRFELLHSRKEGERAVMRNWARRVVHPARYEFLNAV